MLSVDLAMQIKSCIYDTHKIDKPPYIKFLADKRKKPGDFWLTGFQMFRMMKNVSGTLAGRVGIVHMLGLTNSFLDTGLCAHLMGWGRAKVLENSAMSGAFFETWVASEIYKIPIL